MSEVKKLMLILLGFSYRQCQRWSRTKTIFFCKFTILDKCLLKFVALSSSANMSSFTAQQIDEMFFPCQFRIFFQNLLYTMQNFCNLRRKRSFRARSSYIFCFFQKKRFRVFLIQTMFLMRCFVANRTFCLSARSRFLSCSVVG